MIYECCMYEGTKKKVWKASISLISRKDELYELEMEGRDSSMYVLTGKYRGGNFIVMPGLDVGSGLAPYHDLYWNTEKLSGLMNKVDAVTVANGLAMIEKLYPKESN